MGKVAFIFPGQGAQKVGMGRAIAEAVASSRETYQSADEALQEPLSRLCFEGPAEELTLTANAQPAILTTSVALLRALGEPCDLAAGHSLGEYSAHVAAGTLAFEDAVRLVRMRGRYMQEAFPPGKGAMAAVLGPAREEVEAICEAIEGVETANYNSPGQVVIAGTVAAVEAASSRLREKKAKVIALAVSAPFHTSFMRPAEARLKPLVDDTPFSDPKVPVVANVHSDLVCTAADARDALIRQVSRPVRWDESVRRMMQEGTTLFVEIGPGKVLSGLIGRIAPDARRVNVEGPSDLDSVREEITRARAE